MADKYFRCDSYLVPDMVLFSKYAFDTVRDGVIFCMRQDKERSVNYELCEGLRSDLDRKGIRSRMMDTRYIHTISQSDRINVLDSFLKRLSSAQAVVTDRLHGMVFCYITGTPCLALSNYNDKVKGVYEWIKDCNYIKFMERMDTEEDVRKATDMIDDLIKLSPGEYKTVLLENEFDRMAEIISKII